MIQAYRAALFVLLTIFGLGTPLVATAARGEALCQELLLSDPTDLDTDLSAVTDATVRIGTAIPGRHGGQRLELVKFGPTWASGHTSVDYDPQGDPRWLVEALGCEAAEFFGFEIASGSKVLVPDRVELMGAIEKINVYLRSKKKQPIPISFYQADEKNVRVKDYIARYLTERGLPMASGGNHFIHDISFHTGAIFAPQVALDFMGAKTEYATGFADYLEQSFAQGTPLEQRAAKVIAHRIRHRAVEMIDGATALLSFYWIAEERASDPDYKAAPALFFALFTVDEAGVARDIFLNFIKTKPMIMAMKNVEGESILPEKIIKMEQIETLLENFTNHNYEKTARVVKHRPMFDPHKPTFEVLEKAFGFDYRNFDQIWLERITEIRAAAKALGARDHAKDQWSSALACAISNSKIGNSPAISPASLTTIKLRE